MRWHSMSDKGANQTPDRKRRQSRIRGQHAVGQDVAEAVVFLDPDLGDGLRLGERLRQAR